MQQGATCTQDNLLGCCQAGCTVSGSYAESFGGTCGWSSTFACDASGNMSHAAVTDTPAACGTGTTTCASATTPFTATATTSVSACPGGAATRTATGSVSCNSSGTCSSDQGTPPLTNIGFGTVSVSASTQPANRFYGVWSYGKDTKKMFTDLAGAKLFDANRFTDSSSFTTSCSGPRGSTCVLVDTTASTVSYNPSLAGSYSVSGNQATVDDAGWFYSYTGSSEKTGAGATVIIGCTAWNGFIPTNASGGTNMCSGEVGTVTATSYLSNFVTGVPSASCGYQDAVTNRYNRFTTQTTTAPPNTSSMRVVINASGQVEYSALQLLPGSGPSNKALATRAQVVEPVYWLEVPRDLHNCRHDPALSASTCN
jgi:type IV pilus assembly protein PilY1